MQGEPVGPVAGVEPSESGSRTGAARPSRPEARGRIHKGRESWPDLTGCHDFARGFLEAYQAE